MEAEEQSGVVEYAPIKGDLFQYWKINAVDEEHNKKTFRVLADSERQRYQAMLQDFYQRRNWEGYWGLKRAFDPLQYAYAHSDFINYDIELLEYLEQLAGLKRSLS